MQSSTILTGTLNNNNRNVSLKAKIYTITTMQHWIKMSNLGHQVWWIRGHTVERNQSNVQ
jgi:hypothetical protein